ncbi:hypothetical protein ACI2L1_18500 [Streptomyces sp. NPDC019531]|uniref:hypothetical protein n=1 Tax=Streptomyces sp. NPDC019531 TaxID=3365062 RepID=UPI00384B0056
MKLSGLRPLMACRQDGGLSFARFRADPALVSLQWPDDVLEQFLFDHGDNAGLRTRLRRHRPARRHVAAGDDPGRGLRRDADRSVRVRRPEVGRHWEEHGTWLRPPILIARRLLDPSDSGLQVVEGRTRVGVLRGRLREGLHVASHHQAWVGRA